MEPLEAVISVRFSGSYKRQCIYRFRFRSSRDQSNIRDSNRSRRFFIEIRQTDVVQEEFNV
jgi:hypothetical protein